MQWKPLGQTSICSCRCKGYLAEIFRGAKQPLLQMRFNTWTRSPPLTLKDTFFQRRQALRRRRRARADRVRGVTLGQLDSFMQSWKTEHLHGRTGRGPVVPPSPLHRLHRSSRPAELPLSQRLHVVQQINIRVLRQPQQRLKERRAVGDLGDESKLATLEICQP